METASNYRYSETELQQQVAQQDSEFELLIAHKRPGTVAMTADSPAGRCPILVGTRGEKDWTRVMVVYGQDYLSRARSYVDRFNNA